MLTCLVSDAVCVLLLQPLHASASSIEQAWYLMLAEDSLGVDVSKLDLVIDIGGGYGQV
jgi:hypothetical protein